MAKFSIIIPVYNMEKYLRECLNSIINQTLQDFEVICINDNSTDNSLKILTEYAKKDNRFIVISQENQGQGVARNKGIDAANGEYLAFVDPDDYIENNMLEQLYKRFKETNASMILFNHFSFEDGTNDKKISDFEQKSIKFGYTIKPNTYFNWKDLKPQKRLTSVNYAAWNKVYSSDFIKKNNIKFAPYRIGEDHLFSISALLLADKIYYDNSVFYNYRRRISSFAHKASDEILFIFDIINGIKTFLIKYGLFQILEDDFEIYVNKLVFRCIKRTPEEKINKYLIKCKKILSSKEYKKLVEKAKYSSLTKTKLSFWEKFFAVKNKKCNNTKIKYINILGFSFVIKKNII